MYKYPPILVFFVLITMLHKLIAGGIAAYMLSTILEGYFSPYLILGGALLILLW